MSTLHEHEQSLAPAAAPPRSSTAGDNAGAHHSEGTCRRCGYPLVGLDDRVGCPECGLLVGFSRLRSEELRHAHRGWLLRLSVGASLTAVAMLAAPIFVGIAAITVDEGLRRRNFFGLVLNLGLGFAALIGLAAGVLLLTGGQSVPVRGPSRRAVRLAMLLVVSFYLMFTSVALAAALDASWMASYQSGSVAELLAFTLAFGTAAAAIPLAVLGFRYLRHLAARAPAPLLAGDSAAYGYVLAATLASPILVFVLMLLFDDLGRRWDGLRTLVMLTLLVSAAVGYCWGAYLLIRYAIAFLWARRQAAKLMRQFDASLDPRLVAYDPPS